MGIIKVDKGSKIGKLLITVVLVIGYWAATLPPNCLKEERAEPFWKSIKKQRSTSKKIDKKIERKLWKAPNIDNLKENKELILYGKDLIVNTAKYLGPKGSVLQITNGLNCQNCHIAAGTQAFGNNYGGVASTYPKLRLKPGKIVNTEGRINACIRCSLNGKPLDKDSKELAAMVAYMEWLGKDVPKGEKPLGAGLIPIAYLDRAADPNKGRKLYNQQCIACHAKDGGGILNPKGTAYIYPPLWGENSYNKSAGLYRISKFARFIKTNMPFGVSHKNPTLSDEQAWDIAAYVNSQPRPDKILKGSWTTKLIRKPIDVPFGPYVDTFSEKQHKFGPYPPIIQAIKIIKKNNIK